MGRVDFGRSKNLELRNNIVHYPTGHIVKSEVAVGITLREAFVINPQQVQNRVVQIVDVDSDMHPA